MSIYRFSDPSLVKEISFHFANDRPPVALLAARQGASSAELLALRDALKSQGWQSVPVFANGKDALEVIGCKGSEQLNAFLQSHGFINGAPQITAEPGDNSKLTAKEWVRRNSLRAAGALNLVGDVALLGSGIKSKKGLEIAAGGLYTAGGAILTRYGDIKTERQVREVLTDTAEFLKKEAAQLSADSELSNILKARREGKLTSAEDFLQRYPAQVTLGAYTLGAGAMLASGFKTGNKWTKAYGVSSLGVKAASFLIPEKPKTDEGKQEQKKPGLIGSVTHWIQEKPLRLFGYGSMVSEVLIGLSAYSEYKNDPQQRSYIFKGITTGTYVLADLLMAISNKDLANAEGKFDADEQRRILALTADAIACQPQESREPLTHKLAHLLATRPEMKDKEYDLEQSIKEQVAHMQTSPWTSRTRTSTIEQQPWRA